MLLRRPGSHGIGASASTGCQPGAEVRSGLIWAVEVLIVRGSECFRYVVGTVPTCPEAVVRSWGGGCVGGAAGGLFARFGWVVDDPSRMLERVQILTAHWIRHRVACLPGVLG
jgi:hypothetical protein